MRRLIPVLLVLGALAALPASAAAASPAVLTDSASSIANTAATLNGRVNPGGQSTTFVFQYGRTTQYTSQTSARSAGSGQTLRHFGVRVGGLTPGTVYHFRIVAGNSSGFAVGADRTFRTHGTPPPGVFTGGTTNNTLTGATLTGVIAPLGKATSYFFQYGLTGFYGLRTNSLQLGATNAVVPVGIGVFALTPHRLYHYRLVANNSSGTSLGEDRVFVTGRFAPRGVTRNAKPRSQAERPFNVAVTGSLRIPSGFPAIETCKGRVRVRFVSRGHVLRSFSVPLLAGLCRYAAGTRLPNSTSGTVLVQVRFLGNALLTPRSAITQRISVG